MKANEIIRGLLDLIDNIDSHNANPSVNISINAEPITSDVNNEIEPDQNFENDDVRRFMQIVDLANTDGSQSPFSNAPNEAYADLNSITTNAGGGMNNPKHPSDQRVQHPSLYPGHQHNAGE